MVEDSTKAPLAAEAGGGTTPESRKRGRAETEAGELARVAEIVLVLSTMGQMRGGRDPTPSEKALMAEAREKLARICESMELHRRKDLFTREMAMAVVVDHGLNPPKDNIPRPPKLSIAEKVANTRKKMEESKEIVVQPSSHQSQLLHVSFGAKTEGHNPSVQGVQRFAPEKTNTVSSSGSQTAPGLQTPTLPSGTSPKQSQVNEAQRCISPLNPFASPSASCSNVRLPEKTEVAPVQLNPTMSAVSFQANNKIQQTAVKVDVAHGITTFHSSAPHNREHEPKPYAIQNPHVVQQIPHVVNFHESSIFSSHNEISKMVQRIFPPKGLDLPNWTPPSTDYISKPMHCITCNNVINDVESLLVCDACEKGVHIKCLLSYQRIVPKAEWHCSNCLASSHGKPLPPKYGRVTRSIAPSRPTSSPGTVHTSEKKTENANTNLNNHQKMISNVKPDIPTALHASIMGHSQIELNTSNKVTNIVPKQETDSSVVSRNINVHKDAPPSHSDERAEIATLPSSLPDSSQHDQNVRLLPCYVQQQISEGSLQMKADSQLLSPEKSGSAMDINPASKELDNKVAVPVNSDIPSNQTNNELSSVSNLKTSVPESDCDTRRENVNVTQGITAEITHGTQETGSKTLSRDNGGSSTDVYNVNWVGDAIRDVEGKSYYESCCVNGFTCKLQDHVFVSSSNGKPFKLQALWEDQTSGTKWAVVHGYYFPNDLPAAILRPPILCNEEVYGSNKTNTILVETISGPCQVLLSEEFEKMNAERSLLGEGRVGLDPIFLCRWIYNESNGAFQCVSR